MRDRNENVTALSDAYLMARYRSGDQDSFETLFHRHYDMVYGVLYRLVGTRGEAEDLAQDVFLKLASGPSRHDENIGGWLYRVATNMGYNALRSAQRRGKHETRAGNEQAVYSAVSAEREAAQRAREDRVRQTLARLKRRDAALLVLREMGLSYRELAEAVGVAPGSVGTLLARAQHSFHQEYVSLFGDEKGNIDESNR